MKKEVVRHHFESVDSTNSWLKRNLRLIGSDQVVMVTAEEQTAGRGRRGAWHSPKGVNLLATFGLQWDREITLLPLIMGIAVAECLEELSFSPMLKWPNDILIEDKKVGGILCEATGKFVLIGIGLNVNMEQFTGIDQPATSLLVESGEEIDVEVITEMLADRFEEMLEEKKKVILTEYQNYLLHQEGDPISFHHQEKVIKGTFSGLDENGFLKLKNKNGDVQTYASGFVS